MPQFTTRDLLWLTVVSAVIVVWWMDRCAVIAAGRRIYGTPASPAPQWPTREAAIEFARSIAGSRSMPQAPSGQE